MKISVLLAVFFFGTGVLLAQGRVKPTIKLTESKPLQGTTTISNAPPTTETHTANQVFYGIKGTVRVSTDCGTFIDVMENGRALSYSSVNIPVEFQKEGTEIIFDYTESARTVAGTCDFSKLVDVFNVKSQKLR